MPLFTKPSAVRSAAEPADGAPLVRENSLLVYVFMPTVSSRQTGPRQGRTS
jgi:hypothetical protein